MTELGNPFASLSENNSLGIIFFALLVGCACLFLGAAARPVVDFFQAANAVILKITGWILAVSPFAILCLMASLIATHGPAVFASLGWYVGTVIGGIVLHVIVLVLLAWKLGGVTPLRLMRGVRDAWLVAFSTRSSAATLPVTLKC